MTRTGPRCPRMQRRRRASSAFIELMARTAGTIDRMQRRAHGADTGRARPHRRTQKKRAASPRPSWMLAFDAVDQDFATLSIEATRMTLVLVSSLPVTFTS
jgi:hypothetical protein